MCGRDIVGDAIDPRTQTAASVEQAKALPDGDMNELKQVTPPVGVSLISPRQSAEGRPVRRDSVFVQLSVVTHSPSRSGPLLEIVAGGDDFLTPLEGFYLLPYAKPSISIKPAPRRAHVEYNKRPLVEHRFLIV